MCQIKKSIQLFCLTISLGLASTTFSQSSPDSLIGVWKFIKKTGGITGDMISSVDHDYIQFTSDCKFISYKGNSLKFSSTYNLRKFTSIYSSTDSVYLISVNNGFIDGSSFKNSKNGLFIRDEYHDGFTSMYKRIRSKKGAKQEIEKQ